MFDNPNESLYTARSRDLNPSQNYNSQAIYIGDSVYANGEAITHSEQNYPRYSDNNTGHLANTHEKTNTLTPRIRFKPKFFESDLAQKRYKV